MRRDAGGWWLAVVLFAAICFFYAGMKVAWKYNAPGMAMRIDRLEKQSELVRETLDTNGMIPAGMQEKWDKTFTEVQNEQTK
jgi:hypothetical protein